MRKQFFRTFIMSGLFMIAAAGSMFAQAPLKVVVDVPFDFVIGDKTLPAGEYSVKSIASGRADTLLVQSADRRSASIILTHGVQAASVQKEAKLLFTQRGNRYFLSQVWTPGISVGRMIPKSRLQREAEAEEVRTTNAQPPIITLTGRTR